MKLINSFLLANAFALISACSGTPPKNLGLHDNQFSPCPSSPNCVSSFASEDPHQIEAIALTSKPDKAFHALHSQLLNAKRVNVKEANYPYLYAEFTSSIMGFVDDVEFYFKENRIEVRSASRIGYSDLGVNRKRIEAIRTMLNKDQ